MMKYQNKVINFENRNTKKVSTIFRTGQPFPILALPNSQNGTTISADFFKTLALKTSYVKFFILPLVLLYLLPEITNDFWTSVSIATLSSRQALLYSSYSLVLTFALDFFQILPHDRHPCPQLTVLVKISPFGTLTL